MAGVGERQSAETGTQRQRARGAVYGGSARLQAARRRLKKIEMSEGDRGRSSTCTVTTTCGIENRPAVLDCVCVEAAARPSTHGDRLSRGLPAALGRRSLSSSSFAAGRANNRHYGGRSKPCGLLTVEHRAAVIQWHFQFVIFSVVLSLATSKRGRSCKLSEVASSASIRKHGTCDAVRLAGHRRNSYNICNWRSFFSHEELDEECAASEGMRSAPRL